MFESRFFLRRKAVPERLMQYGFVPEGESFLFETPILENQFHLNVSISPDGTVQTTVLDCETQEEYMLYKADTAVGSFVGDVRSAVEEVLTEIAEQCYEPVIFHAEQTHALIGYVRRTYGDELEFLWPEKFPDNAVWRRKDNRKWYALFLTLAGSKLGLPTDEVYEIVDLRVPKDQVEGLVDRERYFPAWHMNKKSWVTFILNGSVPTEELCQRIDDSYLLARR